MEIVGTQPGPWSATRLGLSVNGEAALDRARNGDVEAFGVVCLELENALWRQATMLCGEAATAEDLVQEALITAWRRLERFDGSCQFLTWVTGILLNIHRNMARKKRFMSLSQLKAHDQKSEEGGEAALDSVTSRVSDPNAGPAERLLASERNGLVRRCLERLPEEQRSVVQLRFFAGAELSEIAAVLGCPEGTVKSRLFHAVRKLAGMSDLRANCVGTNTEIPL
jgi:RNA polymerase sigma-70 factor (ECF subfamily)